MYPIQALSFVIFLNPLLASATSSQEVLEIYSQTPQRYHFNLKAPVTLYKDGKKLRLPPSKLTEKEVLFNIQNPETSQYKLDFFLCDDAMTVCERNSALVSWNLNRAQFQVTSLLKNTHGVVEAKLTSLK